MRPAARNSMWRFGFGTPINYSDNEVFCGGVGSKYLLVKVSNSLEMLDFFKRDLARDTLCLLIFYAAHEKGAHIIMTE